MSYKGKKRNFTARRMLLTYTCLAKIFIPKLCSEGVFDMTISFSDACFVRFELNIISNNLSSGIVLKRCKVVGGWETILLFFNKKTLGEVPL